MDIHGLDGIFKPRRIALLGVNSNPNSVGRKTLTNLVTAGFDGLVYPVNPSLEAVSGIQCYPSITSLSQVPDLGIICTPATQVQAAVKECGEAGVRGLIILSAGFKESGPAGIELESEIKAISSEFEGMRILGPNCLGIIVPHLNLNASFASGMARKGHTAFISQSGALGAAVLDWAAEEGIGFSHFVSIGNCIDVGFADLIDYFDEDEQTDSLILYIESIENARSFMTAARAFSRNKPIVAYKAGRFSESAEVAASHTGALAAEDSVYNAAFQRAGIARVFDIGDIFDCTELIGRNKIPKGPRLGIITNAGGPGVMAADALIESGGTLAKLSPGTISRLDETLPPMWSRRNPVDVLGDAKSKRIMKAVHSVLDDADVDAVLVILTPQAMTNPTITAKALSEAAQPSSKLILTAWLGGERMREGNRILSKAGIPTYRTPEQAVRAFMMLVNHACDLENLYETPKDMPVRFVVDRNDSQSQFLDIVSTSGSILSEAVSKKLLDAYGIPVTNTIPAATEEEAVRISEELGFPVALKIASPQITHKTDVGGVALGLEDPGMVRSAYKQMSARVERSFPEARVDGVTVQPMINGRSKVELIMGAKRDPVFGTVIMAGAGGDKAELLGDIALGFPPLNEKLALRMLESLKVWPLLQGYRGRPPVDLDKVIEILMRLSYLVADHPEISELDINPLLAGKDGVIAVDARVVIDQDLIKNPPPHYSHLAMRPYPEEYVREAELKDGSSILLRPIKPEDEPMWFELLRNCSRESIYSRFRYFFHWESHEVASRYCFIDYDREIAIVAEREIEGERRLLGVGRLVADPNHDTAEYAVLIADAWQNMGLGSLLTDYCLQIAEDWGVKIIRAETTSDNPRMISVFKSKDFHVDFDSASSLVVVNKSLRVS
jgi:acetyltransferase